MSPVNSTSSPACIPGSTESINCSVRLELLGFVIHFRQQNIAQRLLGSKLASHLPSICCSSSQEFLNHTYLWRLNPWSHKETLEELLYIMISSYEIPLTNHLLSS